MDDASMSFIRFKDTHREKAPSNKTYKKFGYGHLGRWYINSTLYKRFLN